MDKRRVLVFPAGTEIGLEIFHALKYCKDLELYGAGQDQVSHAPFLFERFHEVPSIYDPLCIDRLRELCSTLRIDYVFPAHDEVIMRLSTHRDSLPARLVAPPHELCRMARSKRETYDALRQVVRTPALFSPDDEPVFPVFVKPDKGQGSVGASLARNRDELSAAVAQLSEPLLCEYLPGEEFTIDCFSDRDRGLLFAAARKRNRMRNGIAVNSTHLELPEAGQIAARISDRLRMRGAWFFQLKRAVDGELTLLEIAPRVAGSMATHRVMGINFPLLSIYEEERIPIQIAANGYSVTLDRALANKYKTDLAFERVYIDLDDTVILAGKINLDVIKLIYKCHNEQKPVILLTRHQGDLAKTLSDCKLDGVFSKIIHLEGREPKSAYIIPEGSIFIDDSFAERSEVRKALNIPTFDCSMVELFL